MSTNPSFEQLDHRIDAVLFGAPSTDTSGDPLLLELESIAAELHPLPRTEFRESLRSQLEAQAAFLASAHKPVLVSSRDDRQVLPSLFLAGNAQHTSARSFAMSMAAHACVLVLVFTSGFWMVKHKEQLAQTTEHISLVSPYVLPPSPDALSGGGGGGDHSKLAAPQGALPKFSMTQITPPAMVVRNESSKLTVDPSVVIPPAVKMQNSALPDLGDPKANIAAPASNGTGLNGGIGSGSGGGIGSGSGPGVGPGIGGGMGGGVFRVGGGVSAPRAIYSPDPEYSEEARKAKYQGTVTLSLIVDPTGRPTNIRVARSLGMGLDEKALEAVKRWRFDPSLKDGHPVAVQVNVEVNFHLY